jgi:hypothetical protein
MAPNFELLFPPGTNVDPRPDILIASRVNYETGSRNNVSLRVIARVKPGVSFEQAQSELDRLSAELRSRFTIKQTSNMNLRIEPMHDDLVADVRPQLVALMGAVVFVLLIACANGQPAPRARLGSGARAVARRHRRQPLASSASWWRKPRLAAIGGGRACCWRNSASTPHPLRLRLPRRRRYRWRCRLSLPLASSPPPWSSACPGMKASRPDVSCCDERAPGWRRLRPLAARRCGRGSRAGVRALAVGPDDHLHRAAERHPGLARTKS